MEQNGTLLDDLLEKLKSSYDPASLAEKKEIVAQLNSWVKAKSEIMGDQTTDELTSVGFESQEYPLLGKSGESGMDSSSLLVVSDLSRITENEFFLQQIAENIAGTALATWPLAPDLEPD